MKRSLLSFILFFSWYAAYAQLPVTGKVYELNTHTTLPYIKVRNTRTKDNTQTNTLGIFSIQAKPGDILILEGFAYRPDTIAVTSTRYLEIYLLPETRNLDEVKIQNTTTRLGNLKDTTLHNQTVRYQTDALGTTVGGITLNFGYGKSSKEKREEQLAYNQAATQQIDKAFSADNIRKYVPLKGSDLKQFIALYRPTIKEYKAPDFDLPFYLNDCYRKFLVLTPEQRKLPVLKTDTIMGQQ